MGIVDLFRFIHLGGDGTGGSHKTGYRRLTPGEFTALEAEFFQRGWELEQAATAAADGAGLGAAVREHQRRA